jgi:short-subunit dehydrogenase
MLSFLPAHAADVINNAGVYGRQLTFSDVTAADMLHTFTTNCIGPLLVVQQLHK